MFLLKIVNELYMVIKILRYFLIKKGGYDKQNPLKKIRESLMMGKTELAGRARISPLTIGRIEKGWNRRIETETDKKIILTP